MKKLTALIAAAAFLATTGFASAFYLPSKTGFTNGIILAQAKDADKDKDKDKDKMGKDKKDKKKKDKKKKDKDKDKM